MPKISVIIPCYFNEGNIPVTTAALIENENRFPEDVEFEYVMVDDASGDGTLGKLLEFKKKDPQRITVLKLRSNVGSYGAIIAGLQHTEGDCIVVMAADLQDPPETIISMYTQWTKGYKVVVGKKLVSVRAMASSPLPWIFHHLMKRIIPTLPSGGFDFCLFDQTLKRQLQKQAQHGINNLYLLLSPGREFREVSFTKSSRQIGESMWTMGRKVSLATRTLLFFASRRVSVLHYLWKTCLAKGSQPLFVIEKIF
ncbi:MAG: glycosyltransferase [Flavobacteriales bacterium]|nr:glycosyltransferase [Flavobacteriales bacterium]